MAKTLYNKRVTHTRTGREGTCLGPAPEHPGWYNILWDSEFDCYRYTRDEFKIEEERKDVST